MTLVILELRSILPNSSHSLRSSQRIICVSLVKIWSLVRKIKYRQAFFMYVPGDLVNKVEVTKSYNSFWLPQINICASFDKIHLAVHKVEQKATSQHRYWNHLI